MDEAHLQNLQFLPLFPRLSGENRVPLVQDTVSFNFSHHPATTGLGALENAHTLGFLAHSTLAVSAVGIPLGVLKQLVWTRDPDETGKRACAEKESCKVRRISRSHRRRRTGCQRCG